MASDPSKFNVEFKFASSVTAEHQALFKEAGARWESVITGDIPDYSGIDDVVIDVDLPLIDGPGGTLGQAGPKDMRPTEVSPTQLPYTGSMSFDSADIAAMIADKTFMPVMLHEIAHVLGFATLWEANKLYNEKEFIYSGTKAVAQYQKLAGNTAFTNIPLERTGGAGTAGGHWEQKLFQGEMMVGFASTTMLIGPLTIAAFDDLGYTVNYTKGDAYSLPTSSTPIVTQSIVKGKILEDYDPFDKDNISFGATTSDTLNGDEGNDTLYSLGGDDSINSGLGDDTIEGGEGNDVIDGGEGNDAAVYTGQLKDFVLTKGATVTLKDTVGTDGTDTVKNVEKLQFNDASINLAIQAKAASIDPATLKTIQELYLGFFKRVPDADGLGYWIDQYKAGQTIKQIADSFYDAGVQYGTVTGYSSTMTNDAFIAIVYKNVLNRPTVDTDGLNHWLNQLATGGKSRGEMVSDLITAAHGYANDTTWSWVDKLLNNKATVADKFAVSWGMGYTTPDESITKGMEIINAVTQDDTTAAINLVGVNSVFA